MPITEERLQNIKSKIMQAIESEVEVILREEFGLANNDIKTLVGRFINERCSINEGGEISSKQLYQAFETWSRSNNSGEFSHISFSQALDKQRYTGVRRVRKQQGSFWKGIILN